MTSLSVSSPILTDAPTTGKLKLLDRVRWHLRVKHYSIRTEQSYVDWVRARKSFAHVPRPSIDEGVFYVYVLRSESDGGFYIGYSSNLRIRLWQHQDGRSRATSYRGPWRLIYYEAYLHQADALGREKYLKSGAGRRFLKAQLRHYLAEGSPRRTG